MADLTEKLREALADSYVLEREVGHGGMATVFLALDRKHDRPVAVKVLHPQLAAAMGPERFQREIRVAARLQHPHILSVYDSGEIPGDAATPPILWFAMPFVEGESLRDRLDRERQLPVHDALQIARETADALEYAHRHGIVHRDIKPENILLGAGHALVADFGIARALSDSTDSSLTQTGTTLGTPAYMSPEQAAGERTIDHRTDIYSLGCVLWEMLAGEPPFTGPTAQALLARRFTETPRPIREVRDTVPEAIEHAVAKALSKAPADRFASAAEFGRALEAGTRASGAMASAPAATAPATSAPKRSTRRVGSMVAFVLGLLVTASMGTLLWQRSQRAVEDDITGAKHLAVLPFENTGSADEEYFADGVTDAVRGKLTGIPGLAVIASNSSGQYKHTTKSLQQIGQELGVQYLVVGKVRWEKNANGVSRVQVSPELIQVSTGMARWQQPFNASITDVFQVQADIAASVADALNIALGASGKAALAEAPTQNLAAYDAFLKGEEAGQKLEVGDPAGLRQAVGYYEQAVALDAKFTEAWARLSRAHSILFYNGAASSAEIEASLNAARRAAMTGPDAPEAYHAMGDYYNFIAADFPKALEQYAAGLRRSPANADLLTSTGIAEQSLGRTDSALVRFKEAAALDPRNAIAARRLARAYLWLRRYPEARVAIDQGLAIAPGNMSVLQNKVMLHLAQGDLPAARAALAGARSVDPAALVAYFALYWDLYWSLTVEQQDLLLRLTPTLFDDSRGPWGLSLAQTYALRGDERRTRAYADTARAGFEEQIRLVPGDAQSHLLLGISLAYAGRKAEAIAAGEKGMQMLPISRDAYVGPYNQLQLVRIYILTGEPEKALDLLEPLLRMPFYVSPGWLRIDPNFDPLRKNPRFERLVKGA